MGFGDFVFGGIGYGTGGGSGGRFIGGATGIIGCTVESSSADDDFSFASIGCIGSVFICSISYSELAYSTNSSSLPFDKIFLVDFCY